MTAALADAFQSWRRETFSPLENTTFRLIWLAGSTSYIGSMVQGTSAAWLMTSITASPLLISFVQSAIAGPFVFFALISGALADKNDRRFQMLVGNILCAVSVLVLALITFFGQVTPASLLFLTALIGTGTTIIGPAWQASVLDIVERKRLTAAISLNNLSFNLARCIGPAVAAELLVYVGAALSFLLNSVTYLFMIIAVLSWKKPPEPAGKSKQPLSSAIRDGLQFAALSPAIRVIIMRVLVMSFFASTAIAMPPLLAVEMNAGARGLGILLTSFGIGAMVGSLLLAYARTRFSVDTLISANCVIFGGALIAVSFASSLWIVAPLFSVIGFAWIQTVAGLQVSMQLSCPRWVIGRVISIFSMALSLGIATGSAFWGYISSVQTLQIALAGSGTGLCMAALMVLKWPFKQPEENALEPSGILRPDTVPNIAATSGPVHVTLIYKVRHGKQRDFRTAMGDLERRRSRDGARNWSLSQDIDDPSRWVEAFESPTWGDYLRRSLRRLKADDAVHDAIMECCDGAPIRRRRIKRPFNAADLADAESPGWDADAREIPWTHIVKSV